MSEVVGKLALDFGIGAVKDAGDGAIKDAADGEIKDVVDIPTVEETLQMAEEYAKDAKDFNVILTDQQKQYIVSFIGSSAISSVPKTSIGASPNDFAYFLVIKVPLIEAINAITNITATFMNPLRKLSAK
jgi:hypothetical protein